MEDTVCEDGEGGVTGRWYEVSDIRYGENIASFRKNSEGRSQGGVPKGCRE